MDKILNNTEDNDYTIVLEPFYTELEINKNEQAASGAAEVKAEAKEDKEQLDRLYSEYEAMCMKEPTILDLDDAYPHSYQWRMRDKYDPAKIEVLKAALKEGKRITDTEAYMEYIEDIKSRRFEPGTWE